MTVQSDDAIFRTLSYVVTSEQPAYTATGVGQLHFQICHRLLVHKHPVAPMQHSFATLITTDKYTGRKIFECNNYLCTLTFI